MDNEPKSQRQKKKDGKEKHRNTSSCYSTSHIRKQEIAVENAKKKRNGK
jgi:hypothetical protein